MMIKSIKGALIMYYKFLKYLLNDDPDRVLSQNGIAIRKLFNPIFRKLMMLFTSGELKLVRKGMVPKGKKIIYAGTHGFHDDIIFSMKIANEHVYLLYGSLLDFFNSFHGLGLWVNGVILVDRKNKQSRKASINKMIACLNMGTNVIMFPEGTWNKNESVPVQKLYPGIYDVAEETRALVVPIATVLDGDKCYAIEGDAYDITKIDDKMSCEILKQQIKKVEKAKDLMIYNSLEQNYIKDVLTVLLGVINNKYDLKDVQGFNIDDKYRQILIDIIQLFNNASFDNMTLDDKIDLFDFISIYLNNAVVDIRGLKTLEHIKEDNIYFSIFQRSENLLKIASQQKKLIAAADLRDKMATMKWELYRPVHEGEFIENYWSEYIQGLIKSTNGLYDHEIEDIIEYKDPDEISQYKVFSVLDNVQITKDNANILVKCKK